MASMFCIACISLGRYITIRKPFNSQFSLNCTLKILHLLQIRKHFYQSIPVVTLLLYFFVIIPMLLTVETIDVTRDRRDCRISDKSIWNPLTSIFVGVSFIGLLTFVSLNYGEIVRHVRRKFSKRKARGKQSTEVHMQLVH
ncbi:unnamed protein product [Gongylonema pulchrum]|uniref:G_PROTEIN_RECEP_F1_2 domain-containing protein n=1 Tax=Gongylonema pulchrum TaxID=637853 RepID=A0A183EB98_9BILA|nr:unnamed protein product [Gongylonema pulchrum]